VEKPDLRLYITYRTAKRYAPPSMAVRYIDGVATKQMLTVLFQSFQPLSVSLTSNIGFPISVLY